MKKYSTLKEFAQFIHLSPETLRDRIAEGRLQAVKQYRGGRREDPRSYRWLVSEEARHAFMVNELVTYFAATKPRLPGFMRRERDWKGRYCSTRGPQGN